MTENYKTLVSILVIGVFAFALWVWSANFKGKSPDGLADNPIWRTYKSEKFGFEIQHPASWKVNDFDQDFVVGINFYPEEEQVTFPMTHHSPNTHVSVYPQGIPTEGVFSEQKNFGGIFNESASYKIDFVLDNKTPWATFISGFEKTPQSWNESGFVWAGLRIQNHTTTCLDQSGAETFEEQCDPLGTGYQIIHHGKVNNDLRAIEEKMLASFKFL